VAYADLSIEVFETPIPATTSPNWSGYVLGNGPFTGATGSFSVPHLVAGTPEGDEVAEWVGIGGVGSSTQLIQAGVSETPDSNAPGGLLVFPWWEVYPTESTSIVINSVVVSAGDEVSIAISQVSGSEWAIALTDDTNQRNYSGPPLTPSTTWERPARIVGNSGSRRISTR
jgi:hypothetical protein